MAQLPKFIGAEDVEKLLKPQELLDKLESAFGRLAQGKDGGVQQPMRSSVSVEKRVWVKCVHASVRPASKPTGKLRPICASNGRILPVYKDSGRRTSYLLVMPGYCSTDDALATKLVSFYPENTELPSHQAWVMLFNPADGNLLAIIDGVSITAIRTGIASAVATKHFAHPNSRILAILGSGVQARSHFEALCLVQPFEEVRVWSRTAAHAQKFAQEIGTSPHMKDGKVIVCSCPEEAVRDADVICTATFAATPIVMKDWVKPGAHINAVGACRPEWQELDSQLMRSAVVYCDSREACLRESGDVILSECEIFADLGEVIIGQKEALWQQTTIFKSVGLAIEDVISAKIVYDEYMKQNTEQLPSFLMSPDSLSLH